MRIRNAEPHDERAVHKLVEALGYPGLDEKAFSRTYAAALRDPAVRLWVVDDGVLLGMTLLSVRPQLRIAGNMVSIDELVVAEHARGRGVGRMLLDAVKRLATETGALRVELHTRRTRESYTRGFYVKNGFTEVDSAVLRWSAG
ncbi:MAG: GNAT family N-acetyltransferase [Myxococcota bacterium]